MTGHVSLDDEKRSILVCTPEHGSGQQLGVV